MIIIKNDEQIQKMREAGKIVADVLELLRENVVAGISTLELDKIAYEYIIKSKAEPSFLGYHKFPNSICVSIDKEIVHGIPKAKRILEEGMIVSIDVGAFKNGYHGDAARTFAVGTISEDKARLIKVTEECFFEGLRMCVVGNRIGDVSYAIQMHAEKNGYGVVRELVGHGIGEKLHESPEVPNFGYKGRGLRLANGMALAIEPMINMGKKEVAFLADGWTAIAADLLPSAHYENTVIIVDGKAEILTL